jgi:broad specificity phosphatase PhoE
MTYLEIKAGMPDEFTQRATDKFRYRYPRGESYYDVIQRLEPVIVELERQRSPVLVIAHQAVLRALYGYLMGKPQDECPYLEIPLHTVIELSPTEYGYDERRFPLLTR